MTYGRVALVIAATTLASSLAHPAVATIDHVHSSSRYDRSPQSLALAARRYAATRATLVTWTEVSAPARAAVLHQWRGWRSFTPPRTDVAASWRMDVWKPRALHAPVLSPHHFTTTGGFRSLTQHAAVAVLDRRRDGLRVLLVVVHLPARPRETPARGRVWTTALAELRELVPRARCRWHPDLTLVVGDWNVAPGRVARAFPDLRLTWPGSAPGVDGTYTDGTARARLLPDDGSSDHRPYVERVATPRHES